MIHQMNDMRVRLTKLLLVIVLGVVLNGALDCVLAYAEPFQSGETQVSLIELYTSEGCSSCPPADAWLSRFQKDARLWKQLVPVAFHVTYWDQLGWKDILGSDTFTARQRDYASLWKTNSVYTPGVVLNGKEWKNWSFDSSRLKRKAKRVGVLKIEQVSDQYFDMVFYPAKNSNDVWTGNIALFGFDVKSDVRRGENAGKKFEHDFVVLDFKVQSLKTKVDGFSARFMLNVENNKMASRYGIAAWVHRHNNQTPIQVVGGYL